MISEKAEGRRGRRRGRRRRRGGRKPVQEEKGKKEMQEEFWWTERAERKHYQQPNSECSPALLTHKRYLSLSLYLSMTLFSHSREGDPTRAGTELDRA